MTIKCWHCNKETSNTDLFCNSCKHIQPVNNINIYELFAIKTSFEVNNKELTNNYFIKQKQIHPDRFITKSSTEKEHALKQGARLNEAYKILCNNVNKAQYLIKLYKWETSEEEDKKIQQKIILEQFELREELASINNSDNLESLQNKVTTKIINCTNCLSIAFEEKDKLSANCKLIELQFLNKLQKDLKNYKK